MELLTDSGSVQTIRLRSILPCYRSPMIFDWMPGDDPQEDIQSKIMGLPQRSKEGWSVGVSFEHYRCQLVIPADTREINVSNTVEFLHHFITTPTLTPEDRILHGINTISNAIQDKPSSTYEAQIQAITKL